MTATVAGRKTGLGGLRQRAVLAVLVAARGRMVPEDRILAHAWGETRPVSAATLHSYIGEFRKALEPGRAARQPARVLVLGREREVADVAALLRRPEHRLLTLTGTGGVGKTRLSVAVSRHMTNEFPDGIVFVALASVRNPALVLPAIGHAVAPGAPEGMDVEALLVEQLRERRMLLVLDNFEHVTDAAATVARLVASCAQLTVLVTSRAALRVRNETTYPVAPLALPSSTKAAFEDVASAAAVRLFVERARSAAPRFRLSPAHAPTVAAICERLAGIPLALEIAAAKIRFLDPRQLLTRLDDAMAADGARDLPDRQRTMRATLDWSYGLLGGPEQRLLRRLAVFSDSFTLEAAEAVGSGPAGVDPVLGPLEELVAQSLVITVADADGRPHYRMLEPDRPVRPDPPRPRHRGRPGSGPCPRRPLPGVGRAGRAGIPASRPGVLAGPHGH
ncbi:MAG TPA: winged helix-turn-helix domain-containing protein [Streptomyces sp.]|nr:winged helix-turn-helix domain-containing protein [Streptomyces sp.]